MSAFTRTHGEYEISDDPTRLDLEAVERLLHGTYWAAQRPREAIEKSIARSISVAAYYRGALVGFARIVTDGVTIAWICDVVIDEAHRGTGLGKALVEAVVTHPEIADVRQILATRDAHTLYEKFGFERSGDVFLTKNFFRNFVPKPGE
ncbi:GCN5-related N-acetyltransferase [Chthoniobacter flavus Ellin428]|uniref:GCN5-related N-acetyltransferase n=1 Tax=Chthoniobacter flavus Ellin428 TaxID=497964 RepID=B4CTW1_9BACT|nr:GNAT family N-acetyltransferase [Chthoniobacter flavus]EDY21999.1 GCN5-related N-acetyltransferase [Chthoniobacter flavus Ellin428]TCO89386.1 acetyltransferase (GNAT) family protein [Chthoniobacter flavus]